MEIFVGPKFWVGQNFCVSKFFRSPKVLWCHKIWRSTFLGGPKFLGRQIIWGSKSLGVQKMLGIILRLIFFKSKNFKGKKLWRSNFSIFFKVKIFWDFKICEVWKFIGAVDIDPQKYWHQTLLTPQKMLTLKKFDPLKILTTKKCWTPNFLLPKSRSPVTNCRSLVTYA